MYKSSQASSKIITSRETGDKSERESMLQDRLQHSQTRMLSLLVSRLAISRLAHAFERVRLLPLREEIMRKRIKRVIENLFKRHDYLAKWEAFQNIRRTALASEKVEQERLKGILKKQRGTMIRLLTHFMLGKKRDILHTTIQRLRERGEVNQQKCNNNLRKGIRAMARIVTRKMSNAFFKVKDSRVIIGQNKRLRNVVMIMKEIRTQNMRWAFVLIRREMVRDRQEKVEEEIQQLNQKLTGEEDEELTGLEKRHEELNGQLEEVRKEREDIQAKLDGEVEEVEQKHQQMKEHIEGLKTRQEDMKKRMMEIDEKLKAPFALQEIYQLCYENLLWTISENPSKNFDRDELLKSLEVPLVPIDLPLDQLKEENDVLKGLLSEYVLMYGEKSLPPGCKLELPYEYLMKENNLLYKMLMTVLPNAQFLREELHKIRQTHAKVEEMVKECAFK